MDKCTRQIIDSISDAVIVTDNNDVIIDVNKRTFDIFLYTKEEILGKNIKKMKFASASGQLYGVRSDNMKFPIDIRTIKTDECKVYIIDDSSIAKKYMEVFETCSELVCTVNIENGELIEVNRAWETILGFEKKEIIGRSYADFVHPDDIKPSDSEMESNMIQNVDHYDGFINRYFTKDGGLKWISWNGLINNETRMSVNFGKDITEIRKLEKERKKMVEYYQSLFNLSVEMISIFDIQKDEFIEINDAFTRVLGYSREEFLSKHYTHFVHPNDLVLTEGAKSQVINDGYVSNYENRYISKDGRTVWLSWNTVRLKQVDVSISITRDITKLKNENMDLIREKEEASSANKAKNYFLSRMSHELRTPLNSIIGFSQLILMTSDLEEDVTDYIRIINNSGKHLLDLINDVLNITKIESGNMTYSIESINVLTVTKEATEMFHSQLLESSIQLFIDETSLNSFIKADYQKLKQVLINLISNAIKFNKPEGNVSVYAKEEDDHIKIMIRDTGIGIENDRMGDLFKPFYRLGAEKKQIEGTGLGLALSKGLVEGMKGIIGIESKVDEGTLAWIKFPKGTNSKVANSTNSSTNISTTSSDKTILYIEDNLENYQLIEYVMKRMGIKLISAIQGKVGIQMAKDNKPDLILLDLHLPDIHGSKVMEILKRENPNIKVIVLSADASPHEINRMKKMGIHKYMTKPVDILLLMNTIKEIFS